MQNNYPKKAIIKDEWRGNKETEAELHVSDPNWGGHEGYFWAGDNFIYEMNWEYYGGYSITQHELIKLIY